MIVLFINFSTSEIFMKKIYFILSLGFCINYTFSQQINSSPVASKPQLAWQDMEYYWFVHFGPNTFTDKEWGLGNEPEDAFNPTHLDCSQWCRMAKAAGAKGIIITAKHHDGFCLWPSKYSTHTVKQSKWKNGKGDVLKELSEACKDYGLKFGVYISPWDRNHPAYGTPAYNDVYVGMMKELFANYSPIWELWWDGANGEGPNGKKQVYDWNRFKETVRKLSPNTVIFSDVGPDARWVGNENGFAGTTNWNLLNTDGFQAGQGAPPTDTLNSGNVDGKYWIPAECDMSIRPGWFYHKEEDEKVKLPQQLFSIYLKSVGRGANMLLNVPADRNGLITSYDSAALIGFKKLRDESFKNNLLKHAMLISEPDKNNKNSHTSNSTISILLKKPIELNCVVLKEKIERGQNIAQATLVVSEHGVEKKKIDITTIGHKRIITFDKTEADEVSLIIHSTKQTPQLYPMEGYLIDESLTEKN